MRGSHLKHKIFPTKTLRILALILLPYKIAIILKLKGHIKRQLISRISDFKKIYRAVWVDRNVYKTTNKNSSTQTNQILLFSNRFKLSLWSFTDVFKKIYYEVKLQFKSASLIWRENNRISFCFFFPCRNFPIASLQENFPEKVDHLERWSSLTCRSRPKFAVPFSNIFVCWEIFKISKETWMSFSPN